MPRAGMGRYRFHHASISSSFVHARRQALIFLDVSTLHVLDNNAPRGWACLAAQIGRHKVCGPANPALS